MKKFNLFALLAVVVTIFSACQKDELTGEEPQAVASVQEKPDVYVENGYLAFKNMNAVDSVMDVLSTMNRQERDAWDAQMGFKSARADFENLFDKYEKLTSKEEFLAFKKKYQNRLTFNDADPEDNSIDYPFHDTYFSQVLNTKGLMKIGQSLYVFNKDNYKIILDGDINAINTEGKNVLTIGKSFLKSYTITTIDDFHKSNPTGNDDRWYTSGKHRLLNELKVIIYVNYLYSNSVTGQSYYEYGYKYYVKQRAQKHNLFGWNDYTTSYNCGSLKFKVDYQNTFVDNGSYTSPSVKPNADVNLYEHNNYGWFSSEPSLSIVALPSRISFTGYTSCADFGSYAYMLHHIEHTSSSLDEFNNPTNPQSFYWASAPY